jgi:hypothetical protein
MSRKRGGAKKEISSDSDNLGFEEKFLVTSVSGKRKTLPPLSCHSPQMIWRILKKAMLDTA